MMCPIFVLLILQVNLAKSQLLASLFDSNCNRYGHSDHGVVTCSYKSHHLSALVSFETY